MSTAIKAMLVGVAMCALAAPAHAYTINGTTPRGGGSVTIELHKPIGPGILQLMLTSPPVNAGTPYVVGFCIGRVANPCNDGLGMSLLPGHSAVVPVDAGLFTTSGYAITVGAGTAVPIPYSLEVDTLR